jgi:hypothetical protein
MPNTRLSAFTVCSVSLGLRCEGRPAKHDSDASQSPNSKAWHPVKLQIQNTGPNDSSADLPAGVIAPAAAAAAVAKRRPPRPAPRQRRHHTPRSACRGRRRGSKHLPPPAAVQPAPQPVHSKTRHWSLWGDSCCQASTNHGPVNHCQGRPLLSSAYHRRRS